MKKKHCVFIKHENESNEHFEKRINDYLEENINSKETTYCSLLCEGNFISIYYELPDKKENKSIGFQNYEYKTTI